jgi:hypothetical protein
MFYSSSGCCPTQLGRTGREVIFELVNVKISPRVEYQSWEKYCNDRAHQNSTFLHKGSESYDLFGEG